MATLFFREVVVLLKNTEVSQRRMGIALYLEKHGNPGGRSTNG